jgi:hypothetical protein
MLCEETSRAYYARDFLDPRAILDAVVKILLGFKCKLGTVVRFSSMLPGGEEVDGDEGCYCCVQA